MDQACQIEPGQDLDAEYNKHFARYLLEHRPRQADEPAGHATDPGS
ncbi:hypothetical protein [Kitasatospora sp. GP82]|nr:hypothetical protein [Kitasatospora sp. GP82]MDH6130020.1 hypothetical protein [Kitasatospora sp. GP82]